MRTRIAILHLLLLAGMFLLPHISFAQTPNTSFFGPIVPQATASGGSAQCPLGLDAVITTVNNLTKFAVAFGIIVAVLVFAYAAILFIMTPFSPNNREEGRTMMLSAVIGLFFVLTAWLIVSAFMALFVGGSSFVSSWQTILIGNGDGPCLAPPKGPSETGAAGSPPPAVAAGGGGGGYTYDPGVQGEMGAESPALQSLLSCMSAQLPSGVGRISAITDLHSGTNSQTIAHCAAVGHQGDSQCAHTTNSCHYGGRTCVGQSYAVDFGDQQNTATLTSAARACNADFIYDEGNHLHVSVGRTCECN